VLSSHSRFQGRGGAGHTHRKTACYSSQGYLDRCTMHTNQKVMSLNKERKPHVSAPTALRVSHITVTQWLDNRGIGKGPDFSFAPGSINGRQGSATKSETRTVLTRRASPFNLWFPEVLRFSGLTPINCCCWGNLLHFSLQRIAYEYLLLLPRSAPWACPDHIAVALLPHPGINLLVSPGPFRPIF